MNRNFMKQKALVAAFFVASVLSVSGCKSSQPSTAPDQTAAQPNGQSAAQPNSGTSNPNSGTNQNGTLNSDGTITPAGQQQAGQAPGQPQAQASASAPATPPPSLAPVSLTAPIGARVQIRTTETLSASHNEVGDGFTGVLDTPLVVHGETLFPRGTRVTGSVVAAKGRGKFKGSGALGIELNTIGGVHLQTSEYERELKGKGKRTGALIGGGTGLGAIIGGIAGGGKGALIGGLAGAGAGTAGAAYTGNKDVVIPSESLVTFHLAKSLTVTRQSK